jgi:flagellar hook-associated protein 2
VLPIDGVNYNLLKADPGVQKTLTLTPNSQKTFDKIKAFVDKYNEIIDKINKKLEEKKNNNYQPLTDDQKKDMSADNIKKWEDKAKEGLISRDSTLENMLSTMRRAFFDGVKSSSGDPDGTNIGITLQQIGLSTSSDISQRGKIIIDETKLKDAIQNKGDKVTQLFTKTSSSVSYYSPDANNQKRSQRYIESGIFQRINDILQDNHRTIRDSNGKKGILLEKAGVQGDYTEFHNLLTDELKDKDKIISDLTRKAAEKENQYYIQFSKLETAMQKMNDQSSWFAQQIGSMNGGK